MIGAGWLAGTVMNPLLLRRTTGGAQIQAICSQVAVKLQAVCMWEGRVGAAIGMAAQPYWTLAWTTPPLQIVDAPWAWFGQHGTRKAHARYTHGTRANGVVRSVRFAYPSIVNVNDE